MALRPAVVSLRHPDKEGDPGLKATAAERMRGINEAHGVLGDDARRQSYDKLLARVR